MLIKREALKAVLPATTSDDTRYFLHAIQIRPDGACVATNGHIALVARATSTPDDADFPIGNVPPYKSDPEKAVLLNVEAANKLIAAMPKRATIPVLQYAQLTKNGDGDVITATDLQVPVSVHLAAEPGINFPDIDRVMPRADRPSLKVALGIPVLRAILKAAEAVTPNKTTGSIVFSIPTEPQHQGHTQPGSEYEAISASDRTCQHCGLLQKQHEESTRFNGQRTRCQVPDGSIIDTIGLRIAPAGGDVVIDGVCMPVKL